MGTAGEKCWGEDLAVTAWTGLRYPPSDSEGKGPAGCCWCSCSPYLSSYRSSLQETLLFISLTRY